MAVLRALIAASVALLGCAPRITTAQVRAARVHAASPYLHLDHWAYADLDLLLDRGVIAGLSPVVRPYRRQDVAWALQGADTVRAGPLTRAVLERLRREFRADLDVPQSGEVRPWVRLEGSSDVTGRTHAHRDVLRPEGRAGVDLAVQADLQFGFGDVAGESRLRYDNYYVQDPQLGTVVGTSFLERAEDAYLELQRPFLGVMVGRLYRNWAPAGMQGTLLSDYAYSVDQAALWAGSDVLRFTLVAARLDDFPGGVRRYLALHRLDFQPSPSLALYLAEATLYAGPGRDFELEFLNPLSIWVAEAGNEGTYRTEVGNNSLGSVGFWWRPRPSAILFGDLMIDDVDFEREQPTSPPPRYAFFGGISLPWISERLAARVTYAQVSNLAYRTFADQERYSFRGLGLAADFSDYDLLRLELAWLASPTLRLVPRIELLRRGEGDLREAWPASLDGVETVLSGTVERTVRLGLGGQVVQGNTLLVEWDLGHNLVANGGHVRGASRSELAGRARIRLMLARRWPVR